MMLPSNMLFISLFLSNGLFRALKPMVMQVKKHISMLRNVYIELRNVNVLLINYQMKEINKLILKHCYLMKMPTQR